MMGGKIITIEGLDGAGKSTQINLLIERLKDLGIRHKFIHFPMLNKGFYGSLIAEYLRGDLGTVQNVHPKLVALLFAEDRNEHKAKLEQWLDEGYLIIMDRYVNSNIAFQCAKTNGVEEKAKLKNWILDFEFNHNNLPRPNLSFYLNVPFHHIETLLRAPRVGEDREYLNGKKDIHEESLSLQKNVYTEYLTLLREQSDFYEIECFGENLNWLLPEVIHNRIFEKIELLNVLEDAKVLAK